MLLSFSICILKNQLIQITAGKSVTKSIADRVALLTYGVINMSMVSVSVCSVRTL